MRKNFLVVSLLLISFPLQAELLIIKKVKDKDGQELFAPLDLEDKADNAAAPVIAQIILKYEWPMCIASDLTEAEKNELLTPGKPYAEEKFIQKKIDEAFKPGKYYVVFVPTCVYELICLKIFFSTVGEKNPLQQIAREIISQHDSYENLVDPKKILKSGKKARQIKKEVNDYYRSFNDSFFKDTFFYIQHELTKEIFSVLGYLEESESISAFGTEFKKDVTTFANQEIEKILGIDKEPMFAQLAKYFTEKEQAEGLEEQRLFFKHLELEKVNKIISIVINLEYEAALANKALLLRGTPPKLRQVGLTKPFSKETVEDLERNILGTTVFRKEDEGERSVENMYSAREMGPYSISFSSSLFAGAIDDYTACAFSYLSRKLNEDDYRMIGYALFIDKKAYTEHQNGNLFFIPPLSPIIELFERGEFFHPRVKAAVFKKEDSNEIEVEGMNQQELLDPAGIFVITRDPLKHAALFSDFLVQNARIIQSGDPHTFTKEEEAFPTEIMKNQKAATAYYKQTKSVVSVLDRFMEKREDTLDQKREAEEKEAKKLAKKNKKKDLKETSKKGNKKQKKDE